MGKVNIHAAFHPKESNDWNNHLPLLLKALEATTGDVVEFGCGDGSTNQLHHYCESSGRKLFSYDTSAEWLEKFMPLKEDWHTLSLVSDWDEVVSRHKDASVILIDHAPGERRWQDAVALKDIKGILILHDTEAQPTMGNYGWENAWPHFKYKVDNQNPPKEGNWNGTWATAVSNTIDISSWANDPELTIFTKRW